MAVLAADAGYVSPVGDVELCMFYSNGDTFYRGSIVFIDATAGGVQALPAAGDVPVGVSLKQQAATTAGDEVEVMVGGNVWLPVGSGITAIDEGDWLVLDIGTTQSDNPADWVAAADITLATNDTRLGRIIRVTSTRMLIHLQAGDLFVTATTGDQYWG